eukprot:GILI01013047.1.p1 GENE.GILI01013047.1~~GILI01013047.1.p1  ORF type:complete len:362 (-),score=64.74 GILI01013047.1:114-1199(-)
MLSALLLVAALCVVQGSRLCFVQIAGPMGALIDHEFVRHSETDFSREGAIGYGWMTTKEAEELGTTAETEGFLLATHPGIVRKENVCCQRFKYYPVDDRCALHAANALKDDLYGHGQMLYPKGANLVGAAFHSRLKLHKGDSAVCIDFARDWKAIIKHGAQGEDNGIRKMSSCLAIRRREVACARQASSMIFSSIVPCLDCTDPDEAEGCHKDHFTGGLYDPQCHVVSDTHDNNMRCMEVDAPPADWTCAPELWDQATDPVCNCNCGTRDPDCDKPDHTTSCDEGQACGPTNVCVDLLDGKTFMDCETGKGCYAQNRERRTSSCEELYMKNGHPIGGSRGADQGEKKSEEKKSQGVNFFSF